MLFFQSHLAGSVITILLLACLILLMWDLFQKQHSILRTYPLIGHLRYIAEKLGIFLRQFFYANDREELPFNRVERSWVYEATKNTDPVRGFGSTRDRKPIGSIYFVDSPFPSLGRETVQGKSITFGKDTAFPYTTKSLINISGMSYGSISERAIMALSAGAKMAGCWLNTGEGGLTSYHLSGGADIIAQIGTGKFGYRDWEGNLSDDRLREAAANPLVKMFEIKLSQGAKPGKGGLLPAAKVTPEIAKIRMVPQYQDCISPNRFPEISNCDELLNFIHHVRTVTNKPTGFKTVLGDYSWLEELCVLINKRGLKYAPDFITLDGSEGGTGASPMSLMDYMGLPIAESLPTLIDILTEYGLREHIKVIASGKLINPSQVAWAFCVGADLVNSARGFLFALGCIQAMRCHTDTCPTGITTHNPWLMRGLDPHSKAVRVYNYHRNLEHEIGTICHSCGVDDPRDLRRSHVRIVSEHGTSVSFAEVYPDKIAGSKVAIGI